MFAFPRSLLWFFLGSLGSGVFVFVLSCGIRIECKADAECPASKPFCQGAICKDSTSRCPRLPCGICQKNEDCPQDRPLCEKDTCIPSTDSGFLCKPPPPLACSPEEICVSTFAGGSATFHDGPALQAIFSEPSGLALAPNGDLLIADSKNHRLRKLSKEGTVCTIAGNGQPGKDDGEASKASFVSPSGLFLASDGRLWIADTGNHLLRALTPTGTVETLTAGEGLQEGPLAQARFRAPSVFAASPDGGIIVSDVGNLRLRKIGADRQVATLLGGGPNLEGPEASVRLCQVNSLLFLADELFFVDTCLHVLRVFGKEGVKRVTGIGIELPPSSVDGTFVDARFNRPFGLAKAPQGFFLADSFGHRIRLLDREKSLVSTYAGTGEPGAKGGGAAQATFHEPTHLALAADGSLLITDRSNHRIRRISPTGEVSTIAGSLSPAASREGSSESARFSSLRAMAMDSKGVLYITEDETFPILRKLEKDGQITTVAGTGKRGFQDGPAKQALFCNPSSLAFDKDDHLYIADSCNFRIRKLSPDGVVTTIAGNGQQGFSTTEGPALQMRLGEIRGLALSPEGELHFSESASIRKLTKGGTVRLVAGDASPGFRDASAFSAELSGPRGLAFAKDGSLFIADAGNHRLRKLDLQGYVSTYAGIGNPGSRNGPARTAEFQSPSFLAFDTQGNLYTLEENTPRIRKITAAGEVVAVAGSPQAGYREGPGNSALFGNLNALLLRSDTLLLVLDHGNRRLRQVALPSSPPSPLPRP